MDNLTGAFREPQRAPEGTRGSYSAPEGSESSRGLQMGPRGHSENPRRLHSEHQKAPEGPSSRAQN
eukprot:1511986-Karenia_brevis.AAC.1